MIPELVGRWPTGGAALARRWIQGEPGPEPFLGGGWRDPGRYRLQMERLESRWTPEDRRALRGWVRAPDPAGARLLDQVIEDAGFVVTTGQQPGLFGGPLYTLYKAATVVRLAERLREQTGRPVAPVFWIASEDHDWAEVDHSWMIDPANVLHRVEWRVPPSAEGRPIFRGVGDEGLLEARDRFEGWFPPGEFSGRERELLRSAWRPGAGLGEALAEFLGDLLGPRGLLLVDASDPALKRASLPVLLHAATRSAEEEEILRTTAGRLDASGFDVQVPILPEGVNLFLEGPAGRERVYRAEEGFRLRHSGLHLDAAALEDRVRTDPSILSPNVLLRPIVESSILPVLAYVGGPGEIAYWAQLGGLFEARGLSMPVVVPRFGTTVVEGKIRKVLDRWSLTPDAFAAPLHELTGRLLREELPREVRDALASLRSGLGQGSAQLVQAASGIDPTLRGPIEGFRNQALSSLGEVERRIVQALRRRQETSLEQLARASLHLFPEGQPQERVISPFYHLARYGRAFVDGILGAVMLPGDEEPPGPTAPTRAEPG